MTSNKKITNREISNKNLKPVKKGEVRNPKGRPPLPEIAFAQKLSKEFVEIKLTEFLQKDLFQLEEILQDKSKPTIDHFIGRIVYLGIKNGDPQRFNFMLDRLIGRVKDIKEIKIPAPTIIERRSGERIELGAEIIDTNTIDVE